MRHGAFTAELARVQMHRLSMLCGWQSLPSIARIGLHKTRNAIFFLTKPDQPSTTLSGIELPPGDIVFPATGGEYYNRGHGNARWGAMSLTPEDLAAYGRAIVGRELVAPRSTRVVRPQHDVMSRLVKLQKAATDLAAAAPKVLAHPEVANAIEQELVRLMIVCLADPQVEEGGRALRLGSTVMRRFEQLLEAHPHQPLHIPEVCAAIGVTDRMLRIYCQEHLGTSPHRYLQLRRLHLARRALASSDPAATTVTEIANDYGFGELGRFAMAYRKVYGEPPSITLRRPPDDRQSRAIARFGGAISGFA
jgi:AraC-like DNA-binding protein